MVAALESIWVILPRLAARPPSPAPCPLVADCDQGTELVLELGYRLADDSQQRIPEQMPLRAHTRSENEAWTAASSGSRDRLCGNPPHLFHVRTIDLDGRNPESSDAIDEVARGHPLRRGGDGHPVILADEQDR